MKNFRVAIINDSRSAYHYGSLLVMKNLEKLLADIGAEVVWYWPIGRDWRKHRNAILDKPKVDAFIVNAEGVIHHGPRRWQATALAEFAGFADRELHTPAYLVNATLHENEKIIYDAIRDYIGVYVRDTASQKILSQHQIEADFVSDLTFAVPSVANRKRAQNICVIDSVMQSDVPYLKKLSRERGYDYRSMIVARPGKYNFWKRPRKCIVETLKWAFRDRHKSLDPAEFEAYLETCRLVVTGRYHAVTMCLNQRVPFVALESNTPKISNLLKDVFGDSRRVIPITDLEGLRAEQWEEYSGLELQAIEAFLVKSVNANRIMIKTIFDSAMSRM